MAKIKLSWPGLAFLACAGAIGIMMYVFSMSLVKGKNIWPLMVFVAQILIPFPLLLFGKQSDDGTGWKTSDPSVLQHLGFWMTGLFVGFGLLEPIFMYNEGILSREQILLMYGAIVWIGVAFGIAAKLCGTREDGYDDIM
eukprot:Hpha_TRINITY_DN16129_c0_g3::TRINITY_DN16129_c0_g3_i1::g.8344::m.8344